MEPTPCHLQNHFVSASKFKACSSFGGGGGGGGGLSTIFDFFEYRKGCSHIDILMMFQ